MSKFPRMLYREGSEIVWEGKGLDTITVADADAEKEALGDGWLKAGDALDDDTVQDTDIASAIAMLDPNEDEHWTNAGLPAVEAVAELTGKSVTRAQIKAAAPDAQRPE